MKNLKKIPKIIKSDNSVIVRFNSSVLNEKKIVI